VAIGEVGLIGELRGVTGLDRRLREAARLGFRRAIVPWAGRRVAEPADSGGLTVVRVSTLGEAVEAALSPGGLAAGSKHTVRAGSPAVIG